MHLGQNGCSDLKLVPLTSLTLDKNGIFGELDPFGDREKTPTTSTPPSRSSSTPSKPRELTSLSFVELAWVR